MVDLLVTLRLLLLGFDELGEILVQRAEMMDVSVQLVQFRLLALLQPTYLIDRSLQPNALAPQLFLESSQLALETLHVNFAG